MEPACVCSYRLSFVCVCVFLYSTTTFETFYIEGRAIHVTGRGGPYDCETSRLPHFLDNRLTDRGEASRAARPSPPGRFLVLISVRG
jgi:hypothetical protein